MKLIYLRSFGHFKFNFKMYPTQLNLFLLSGLVFLFMSCAVRNNNATAIKQGVSGRVTFEEGNLMPGPGKNTAALQKGVKRDILIYEVATTIQAEGQRPLFTKVNTKLAARIKSDSTGYFQCTLSPGRYSILTVEEGGRLFSGISNEKDELSPVDVKPDTVSVYNITVNYKAVY